jgi:hypothetical protein
MPALNDAVTSYVTKHQGNLEHVPTNHQEPKDFSFKKTQMENSKFNFLLLYVIVPLSRIF